MDGCYYFMCKHVQVTDEFYLNFISLRQLKFTVLRPLSEFCKICFWKSSFFVWVEKLQNCLHEIKYADKKVLWQNTLIIFRTYIVFQNKIILKIAPILDMPFVFHQYTCIMQALVQSFPLVMSRTELACLQCCPFYNLDPSLGCRRGNV